MLYNVYSAGQRNSRKLLALEPDLFRAHGTVGWDRDQEKDVEDDTS